MGEQSPDEEAAQGRGRSLGEQDGKDHVGAPGSQRGVPASCIGLHQNSKTEDNQIGGVLRM